jgi:sarcosine oxidase subunit beta
MTNEPAASAGLVIIGGGIVGAATAFYAAREGLRPVVIEQRPGIGTLTTPASTGAFRAQFDNPEEIMLVQESIALFLRMEQVAQVRGYTLRIHQQGYLFVTTSPERVAFQKAMVERQHSWGLTDVEWLDGAQARSRFPYLSDAVVGARTAADRGLRRGRTGDRGALRREHRRDRLRYRGRAAPRSRHIEGARAHGGGGDSGRTVLGRGSGAGRGGCAAQPGEAAETGAARRARGAAERPHDH